MEVKMWKLTYLLAAATLTITASAIEVHIGVPDNSDTGNWKVGDCILAQFAMEFEIFPNATKDDTLKVDVPSDAVANADQSNCGNDTQTLNLTWKRKASNDTNVYLSRSVTVIFGKQANESYYGVHRFYAEFEMAKFKFNETIAVSTLQIDSKERERLMFLTPLDRSFLCANINTVSLRTSLKYNISGTVPQTWHNTSLTAQHVQFDAFRPTDHIPSGFRTPMDCDYQPNDIVPIAVGVALAGLVVAVLIAYMVGRRRHMQRGYQSV